VKKFLDLIAQNTPQEAGDPLGRMLYDLISQSIDKINISEKEKQELRDAYLW